RPAPKHIKGLVWRQGRVAGVTKGEHISSAQGRWYVLKDRTTQSRAVQIDRLRAFSRRPISADQIHRLPAHVPRPDGAARGNPHKGSSDDRLLEAPVAD